MEIIKTVIYWAGYAYYLYVFGYASLYKVFQKTSMMQSMKSLGFNIPSTILIGVLELLGVVMLVVGLFKPQFRNIAALYLFPFAIGAFTAHMAHNEYNHYYSSLLMCMISVVLLVLDKNFKIMV
ncbi:DoxX family protein [Chryseobacterium sp. WG14]|uniref:DoxX family protein n=1 Tax=unclassified Chryseobacterium TaxID=2593645 RepID=UPI00211EE314|nr:MULTISPECIES: DoxX family protein [unclassified Chryseobacterium]MCQ9637363.1 DoxX family protein [Chryseobacterium sp. WG23]MCQ9639547.1 DoxX family protein [Chryseobacterium sp. WG14]